MHNRKINKDLSLWRRILIMVAGWLLALANPPAPPVDYRVKTYYYSKLASGVRAMLADLYGTRVCGSTVTASTAWLYWAIVDRINKRTGGGELTIEDLIGATGMKRDTVITHTKVLEGLGLIAVSRSKSGPKRNATNVYRLSGPYAEIPLIVAKSPINRLPQSAEQTPAVEGIDRFLQRYENNDEQTKQDVVVVGPEEEPTPEILGEGSDTGREEQDVALEADTEPSPVASIEKQAVAELETLGVKGGGDMVRQYGAARVLEVCHHYTPDKATGWIVTALQRGWHLKRKVPAEDSSPMRYITGKYADFINH